MNLNKYPYLEVAPKGPSKDPGTGVSVDTDQAKPAYETCLDSNRRPVYFSLMTQTNTRDLLINEGLNALLAGGYDGTGIGPVLKAAGVPKGSFYHFFDSKEAFAGAVLDAYAERYGRVRREILHDRSRQPLDRLRRYFTYMSELLNREDFGGCLFGNLAFASATRSPAFREQLQHGFQVWQGDLASVLREAQAAGEIAEDLDPEETADFLIDAYEGALLRAKSEGDTRPMERFTHLTLTRLLPPTN